MERVGTRGLYQRILFALTLLAFFSIAFEITGTPFLFLNTEFDCSGIDANMSSE